MNPERADMFSKEQYINKVIWEREVGVGWGGWLVVVAELCTKPVKWRVDFVQLHILQRTQTNFTPEGSTGMGIAMFSVQQFKCSPFKVTSHYLTRKLRGSLEQILCKVTHTR